MKTWIQTRSGKKLEPLALTVDMVGSIDEIAHSLSGENRFTRQTPEFYSVAQHCVLGSELLAPVFAGAFLLHELSEVYLPDIAGPLKSSLLVDVGTQERPCRIEWSALERLHTHVMLEALGLISIEPLIYSPEIKTMDLAMLHAEKLRFFETQPEPWGDLPPPANCGRIYAWTPENAKERFLKRFQELFGDR